MITSSHMSDPSNASYLYAAYAIAFAVFGGYVVRLVLATRRSRGKRP